jgi:hypothetical protein
VSHGSGERARTGPPPFAVFLRAGQQGCPCLDTHMGAPVPSALH